MPHLKLFSAAAVLFALLTACSKPEEKDAEPVAPVEVAVAVRQPIRRTITASGILWPKDQASIMPKISAPIRKFHVNRGDPVRAGELVAELENRDIQASVSENRSLVDQAESAYRNLSAGSLPQEMAKAQSDLQAAKEALDASRKLYESRTELLKEGALARRQVDEASVAYTQAQSQYEIAHKQLETIQKVGQQEQIRAAKAQLDAARARFEAAQAQLSYTEIRSPISGVVTDRPLFEGEMAASGTPIVTVMDISRVIAKVNLTQEQASHLKIGDPATITAPEGSVEGKLTVISPAVNPNSTTVEVWVEASNPQALLWNTRTTETGAGVVPGRPVDRAGPCSLLRPGGNVRVAFQADSVPDAVVVPASALISSKEGELTVLVAGKDNLAHEHQVETGIRAAETVQIVNGVNAGDQVIVSGGIGLDDGAKIRVEKAKPQADGKE